MKLSCEKCGKFVHALYPHDLYEGVCKVCFDKATEVAAAWKIEPKDRNAAIYKTAEQIMHDGERTSYADIAVRMMKRGVSCSKFIVRKQMEEKGLSIVGGIVVISEAG